MWSRPAARRLHSQGHVRPITSAHRWRYPSFISAANQAGWSRRYGGIHLGKKARYHFEGGPTHPRCQPQQRCPTPDRIPDGEAAWVELR